MTGLSSVWDPAGHSFFDDTFLRFSSLSCCSHNLLNFLHFSNYSFGVSWRGLSSWWLIIRSILGLFLMSLLCHINTNSLWLNLVLEFEIPSICWWTTYLYLRTLPPLNSRPLSFHPIALFYVKSNVPKTQQLSLSPQSNSIHPCFPTQQKIPSSPSCSGLVIWVTFDLCLFLN